MAKPSILIVEDDENIRTLYELAFLNAKMNVYTAKNGAEGVLSAFKHHPDAILIDIMMPILNGHDAVNKIRSDPWGKKVTIVYLTNMSDAENVVHAVKQGSSEYIIKANMAPKEVVNKVRMAMRA